MLATTAAQDFRIITNLNTQGQPDLWVWQTLTYYVVERGYYSKAHSLFLAFFLSSTGSRQKFECVEWVERDIADHNEYGKEAMHELNSCLEKG
jgi:hypothetical protein